MEAFPESFADLLRQLAKRFPSKELADALGISIWSFYNYLQGRSNFPPELLSQLYIYTSDKRIIDFLLRGTGLIAIRDPAAKRPGLRDPCWLKIAQKLSEVLSYLLDYYHHGDLKKQKLLSEKLIELAEILLESGKRLQFPGK